MVEPSAAFMLSALGSAPGSTGLSALVVGKPDVGGGGVRFRGAESEAHAVAGIYARVKVLTGATATHDSVVRSLGRYTVFHFAGHALFDPERPERSALLLAGPAESNRLEAGEIASMNLSNARLVVLSACRTLGSRASHNGARARLAVRVLRAGSPATVGPH